jgi:1-acyl-sn-glycerol-3-phosphate acyltransferase
MNRRYQAVVGLARLLCGAFFREVEVVGLENVPTDRGGVLVSWHPNGVIDPGIILATFPAQITFGARDGLFRVPLFGTLLRAAGAVPIHRAQDAGPELTVEERRTANLRALDRLAEEVVAGHFSCLFPEGDSHDHPFLLDLKSGAARFFYRAWQLSNQGGPPPALIPVGLHYDAKHAFRSHVLVEFHPPIDLGPDLNRPPRTDDPEPDQRSRVELLTGELERVLQEVVHATESWEVHFLMHRVRKLMRAERANRAGSRLRKPSIRERQLAFARVWDGFRRLEAQEPAAVERLRERVSAYDQEIRALGLEDHELDRGPSVLRPGLALLAVARAFAVYFLLPPILLLGVAAHLPALGALWVATRIGAKRKKDIASIKLLLGAVVFPLTWLTVALFAFFAHSQANLLFPWLPNMPGLMAVMSVLTSVVGGGFALRYLRISRETIRGLKVRLTRARRRSAILRLRGERSDIVEAIERLTHDLDLPGVVAVDGRVVPDGQVEPHEILRE